MTSAATITEINNRLEAVYQTKIKQLVARRCGLYFKDHEMKSLEAAIKKRMKQRELASLSDYHACLSCQDTVEFRELLNLLTIRHTYFFRNEPHFSGLREKILPDLIAQKRKAAGLGRPTLRIWSAGCSTGEEAYSIAMTVCDVLPDHSHWDIRITATDVSTQALEAARVGKYDENAMKLITPDHRDRYFKPLAGDEAGRHYQICNTVRQLVDYSYLNLLEDAYPEKQDIIFCRNVMIYFDQTHMVDIVMKFADSLTEAGILFLGYSETLQGLACPFRLTAFNNTLYYQKHACGDTLEPTPVAIGDPSGPPVRSHSEHRDHGIYCAALNTVPAEHDQVLEAVAEKAYEKALALVHALYKQGRQDAELMFLEAQIYTNQGLYEAAGKTIQRVLDQDGFYAPAYYLLGTIALEKEQWESAERHLKKAIYLQPEFPMAHFALALTYRQIDRVSDAIREFRNVSNQLDGKKAEEGVPYSGGFSHATLISICQNNIERMRQLS